MDVFSSQQLERLSGEGEDMLSGSGEEESTLSPSCLPY